MADFLNFFINIIYSYLLIILYNSNIITKILYIYDNNRLVKLLW